MHTPRAVVIGYGFAGRCFHSYLIGLTPGLSLHGIASRDPATRERIQQERACKAYEGFDAVLADKDVDLVVLATPNHTHADLAVAALEAGKHVVTDKVMCLSLADCDRMIRAARDNERMLSVFQNRRWDGDFLTVRKLIGAGELGDVRWIEMAWQGFGAWKGWRGEADKGGGRFFDLGAHLVDQLLVLCPEAVTSVYARMHHDLPDTDTESSALVVVTFASGRTGVLDMSSLNAVPKPRFYVCGTRATFAKHGLDPQEKAMIAGSIDAAEEAPALFGRLHNGAQERTVPTERGRWRNYYENIAAVLAGEAEPAIRLEEARRAIGVLDAARRSAHDGAAVATDLAEVSA